MIEARFVEVNDDALKELSFDWLFSPTTQTAVAPGGTSGHDANLAISSNASGGPSDIQYFLYKDHPATGALPILNKNFDSPFDTVKTVFTLPTTGCVVFAPGATSTPLNHPGGDPVDNLDTFDGGYPDVASLGYLLRTSQQAQDLIEVLANIAGTEIFFPPMVRVYPGQSVFHMIDDVEPDLDDFSSGFKMRIQDVTMAPFGNFTGPVVDITPTISADSVHIQFRIGTELATFFFSTAFLVDGVPTDAEIPLHRRSTTAAGFTVPMGQTLVVGGLFRVGAEEAENGLPILGDIPLVGSLFMHKHLDPAASRLLVFLTPTIVDAN